MSSEQHLRTERSFRYYVKGNPEEAHTILYVLHGYGQLARFFIEKFKGVQDGYCIIAPEGMHRFYLNGSSGRVGASWMTKEDRETDINDNISWLADLDILVSAKAPNVKKILLGFSQGGATAARWFFHPGSNFDHLIIWASVFPPDLKKEEVIEFSSEKSCYFTIGTEDEYYTAEQQQEILTFYQDMGFKTFQFKGRHDIENETLRQIIRSLHSKNN